jgi:hypothetical protein
MIIRDAVMMTSMFLFVTMGCSTQNLSPGVDAVIDGDLVEVISVAPGEASELGLGEKVEVEVFYRLGTVEQGTIWVRPYQGGRRAGGYAAHHLVPVAKADGDSGIVNGWFYFNAPASVDEVRVFLQDSTRGAVVKELSHPAALRWSGKNPAVAANNTEAAPKPAGGGVSSCSRTVVSGTAAAAKSN